MHLWNFRMRYKIIRDSVIRIFRFNKARLLKHFSFYNYRLHGIAIYLFIHLLNTNTMWKVINFSALSLHVIEWVNDTSDHIRYLLPYLCSHLRTLSAGISLFCLFSLCRLIFIDNWKCWMSWINKILEQWYI